MLPRCPCQPAGVLKRFCGSAIVIPIIVNPARPELDLRQTPVILLGPGGRRQCPGEGFGLSQPPQILLGLIDGEGNPNYRPSEKELDKALS